MSDLRRDPAAAAAADYDVIIIGGGIYGAMTTLEAARRGLRPLLLERNDFGSATSWNSHRIVHGGLRYLQSLDLERFRTSVHERSWLLRNFPDLVEPLTCLMPLYGEGARRPGILRLALMVNDLLSRRRNEGLRADRRIESGGVMTAKETLSLFPAVRQEGLRGGALWYDAVMRDSQRLLIETLRWATSAGARCLNYVEATKLITADGRVAGVEATDRSSGEALSFGAARVINCAGPWSPDVARSLDRDVASLFAPSLAFNLLFDREPPEIAVAVSSTNPGAHTWFLYPRRGRTYAGTAHFPWHGGDGPVEPSRQQIDEVIADINAAVPALDLRRHQVARVFAGLLPAAGTGTADLATSPVIHDHADTGRRGLISVSGVKYTTARDVAEQALRRAFEDLADIDEEASRPAPAQAPDIAAVRTMDEALDADLAAAIGEFARREAVVEIDDLVLRRGAWGEHPEAAQSLREKLRAVVDESGAPASLNRRR